MSCLNDRAYRLLKGAIRARYQQHPIANAQKELLFRRLEKLRLQPGEPVGVTDLQAIVSDVWPDFDPGVLKSAARLNQPKSGGWRWGCGLTGLILVLGAIGTANLPLPPLRKAVANSAPALLLPSFWMMDRDYRTATADTAAAQQLLDNATSAADIDLGDSKTKTAQDALNRLPVWFLGERPDIYCSLCSCRWRFTFDEFEALRRTIGRLEARVFQERNAQGLLAQANEAIAKARQQHKAALNPADKNSALGSWQAGIDRLREIPQNTLAGKQARAKVLVAERDFQAITGAAAGKQQVGGLIAGAKEYGFRAALAAQKPPHPAEQWRTVQNLWREALGLLQQIKSDDPDFVAAQKLSAEYQQNLQIAIQRETIERQSQAAIDQADAAIAQWRTLAAANPGNPRLLGIIQMIEDQLERVHPASTAYAKATQLQQFANQALQRYQLIAPSPLAVPPATPPPAQLTLP
jgi:hypothetical protein